MKFDLRRWGGSWIHNLGLGVTNFKTWALEWLNLKCPFCPPNCQIGGSGLVWVKKGLVGWDGLTSSKKKQWIVTGNLVAGDKFEGQPRLDQQREARQRGAGWWHGSQEVVAHRKITTEVGNAGEEEQWCRWSLWLSWDERGRRRAEGAAVSITKTMKKMAKVAEKLMAFIHHSLTHWRLFGR